MIANADKKAACPTESLIGAGTVVAGDICFCGGLRIDGEVRGNVRALDSEAGTLVIGEKGRVEGDIDVARLIVNGQVTGRVAASEFVRVQSKAQLKGDVDYAAAEIHLGAVVQGLLLPRPCAAPIAESAALNAVLSTPLEAAAVAL